MWRSRPTMSRLRSAGRGWRSRWWLGATSPPNRAADASIPCGRWCERVVGAIASWALEARSGRRGLGSATRFGTSWPRWSLTQRATFATPVWLNAGLGERPLTSACFILKAEDSIPELLDWNTREGLIFQQGGGAGINLSPVRSSREAVSRGGLASGPVSFMRATDAWAATIRAGGRARRGAKMVVLDASHPDILEFIEAKAREEDRGRALLAAGYSVEEVVSSLAFQHANHSVRVSDEFMRLALDGGDWQLRAVTTGEVLETLPARRVLSACAEAACRCGDPGLLFADQIARWHTCPNTGPVTASQSVRRVPERGRLGLQPRHPQPPGLSAGARLRHRRLHQRGGDAGASRRTRSSTAPGIRARQSSATPSGCARSGSATPISPRCC